MSIFEIQVHSNARAPVRRECLTSVDQVLYRIKSKAAGEILAIHAPTNLSRADHFRLQQGGAGLSARVGESRADTAGPASSLDVRRRAGLTVECRAVLTLQGSRRRPGACR